MTLFKQGLMRINTFSKEGRGKFIQKILKSKIKLSRGLPESILVIKIHSTPSFFEYFLT